MPKPNKGESKNDYLKRCTDELIENENRSAEQAYKLCNLYWDDAHNQRSILNLSMPVEMIKKDDADGKDSLRKFMITAYTGKELTTWWGKVIFDLKGIKTKEKIPVLREHRRDRVVGFGRAFKDQKNLYVDGDFSKSTKDAKEVLDLAEEGYPWQASIAIWPRVVKYLADEKAKAKVNGREVVGPDMEIWEQSDVGEVSFVSLGRDDDTAAITLNESEGKTTVDINILNSKELNIMEFTIENLQTEAPELLKQIQDEYFEKGKTEGLAQGTAEERQRVAEILKADADAVETRKAIESGVSADGAYKQFYEADRKKRALGLDEMKASATKTAGQDAPEDEVIEEETEKKDLKTQRREWRPEIGPAAA